MTRKTKGRENIDPSARSTTKGTSVVNTEVSRRTVLKGTAAAAAVVSVSAVAKGMKLERFEQSSTSSASSVPGAVSETAPALWNDINIILNGTATNLKVQANWTLSKALRETLGMTGTKISCENSICGACTVLMDGDPIYSCSRLAVEADGHDITTIEGIGTATNLHPVQQAFINYGAFACGQCTPGFIMSAVALLKKTPNPTQDQIVKALSGNICRCGSYVHIIQALTSGTPGALS